MKNIAIHHTAVSRDKQRNQLNPVNRYHRDKKRYRKSALGWNVGYNYFIDVNGVLTQTRKVGEETMANAGHNCDRPETCDTISVCLAGNFHKELPSDKQLPTLRDFIERTKFQFPDINVVFHRSLQANRTCPGALFTQQYLNQRVLQIGQEAPDPQDRAKEEEILKLRKKIDTLRGLIRWLVNLKFRK